MSAPLSSELLLRCYPRAWRARYGDELRGLIADMSAGGRKQRWRLGSDVALAGARERLRSAGLGDDHGAPGARTRAGALLVLCAWALFVVAGATLQRLSEHWQDLTPAAGRSLPSGAFVALVVAAIYGASVVLCGIALTIPDVVAFLRSGGWRQIRRHVLAAGGLTVLAVAATVALVGWAHGLTAAQRNGHDAVYAAGFVGWALLVVGCLFAWTAAAVAIGRRLTLPAFALEAQAWLACAAAGAMGVGTVATVVWWAALGDRSRAALFAPELVGVVVTMALATAAGAAGARRAWRAQAAIAS